MKTRVLIFVEHYLPGYKAGGPLQSIAGLVRALGSEIEFSIVTRDRDFGDLEPYAIANADWQDRGDSQVRYVEFSLFGPTLVDSLFEQIKPDVVYLDGYFGPMTRAMLAIRRRSRGWPHRTIVHPQGQFSRGALGLKSLKKRSYLLGARTLGLHMGLEWRASNVAEATEIKAVIGSDAVVHVVPDLFKPLCTEMPSRSEPKMPGHARFVYLSRVTAKKNLLFLLSLLPRVSGRIDLTIAGPVDDNPYWRQCCAMIASLPQRIQVHHDAGRPHDQVLDVLVAHDFFVLPTLGENFGHAVAEALQAGLPVLVSERTPWRDLEQTGAGWDLPLDVDTWVRVLDQCVAMDRDRHEFLRLGARSYVSRILNSGQDQNRTLFQTGTLSPERFGPVTVSS